MKIEKNYSLKHLNTFGVDVTARYFAEVRSDEELLEVLRDPAFRDMKKFILGSGSNVLFTKDFDGLVIKQSTPGIQCLGKENGKTTVRAGGGMDWQAFVDWTLEQNFAGLENLSLIPGSVGAAPVQNIGAYGVELKDVFMELEALDLHTLEKVRFSSGDCRFGYRTSLFKNDLRGKYSISSVTFRLTDLSAPGAVYKATTGYGDIQNVLEEMKVTEPTPRIISNAISNIRRSKLPDPKILGNAGSFFKNPVVTPERAYELLKKNIHMPQFKDGDMFKIPAGWLIDQCGWKGKRVGNTGCYEKQALVIVNYGPATALEVLGLAYNIQLSVKEKFGIDLSPEVNII